MFLYIKCQESYSSIGTSWCFQQRHLRFKSPTTIVTIKKKFFILKFSCSLLFTFISIDLFLPTYVIATLLHFIWSLICVPPPPPLPDQIVGDSIAFALGLATTLAVLGIAASFAGKAYGQIGQGLPLAASGLAVLMGLNLLEVLIHVFMVFWVLLPHNIC